MRTFTRLLTGGFLACCLLAEPVGSAAQEYRMIDGTMNNPTHPAWGAAGILLSTAATVGYDDGVSAPAGPARPNPRFISNALFSQNTLADDPRGLSAYTWAWGQFIDHDITLVGDHPTETMDIPVPPFDAFFDPLGTGEVVIGMHRSDYDPATGTGPDNPRRHKNGITAFIDASAVYGSDLTRAGWLRTFSGGKLKMSAGNLPPFNTLTGEYDGPVDPAAPEMAMPMPFVQKWFVAGDLRANENPMLLSLHALFMREHNRLCDELALVHPGWNDEQLYQQARKLVGAIMQAIVYEEWLPTLGMHLEPYAGYQDDVDPGILNTFSAAAYRYGHSTINSALLRMDHEGNTMPEGDILLRDAYFNPDVVLEVDGIEPYLIGMSTVVEQNFDCKVIDDLRNFLFGPPGAGGLDLVALNINRGRDRGLPDFSTLRTDFDLAPLTDFSDVTADPLMAMALENVYQEVDRIDPWVGMLAEDHMPDALFGPTAMTILQRQFTSLRDGDRFYFEHDPWLTSEEKDWIRSQRLSDVVRRNCPIDCLHDELFIAQPLLSTGLLTIAGAEAPDLLLYPNPATQWISLRFGKAMRTEGELRLVDPFGRTIYRRSVAPVPAGGSLEVQLDPSWPAGLYRCFLIADGQLSQQSFVRLTP
ncbi:MAG: hypothetical protein KDC30_08805 [Saprospiraceae bacterium]|nr:hypothetical protein [Saprospiraceae bacterium]